MKTQQAKLGDLLEKLVNIANILFIFKRGKIKSQKTKH